MYILLSPLMIRYAPLLLGWLIIMIYIMFLILVFINVAEKNLFQCIYISLGTLSVIGCLWSLYVTSTSDPGFIHKNKEFDQQQLKGEQRYCDHCEIYKPERSHHCSKCRRCVLNMDHHCVWTANCIGLLNRKSFNLILLYGSFGMLNATFLGLSCAEQIYKNIWSTYQASKYFHCGLYIFTIFTVISQFFNALGLYYFTYSNLSLVLENFTTIDDSKRTAFKRSYPDIEPPHNEYDFGTKYNFQFYFGKHPLSWLFPRGKPLGDGFYWDKKTQNIQLKTL